MQFLAQDTSTMANIPTVVLHPHHIAYLVEADGIQVAGDGFLEINLTSIVCLLNQTIAPTIVVRSGKDAVFVIHNRSNLLTRRIEVCHGAARSLSYGRHRYIRYHGGQHIATPHPAPLQSLFAQP